MKHIMIDLETLGTHPNSVIVQIGAVVFDPERGAVGYEFSENVDIQSCLDLGLECDGPTLEWWFGRPSDERTFLDQPKSVDDVFCAFGSWLQSMEHDPSKIIGWSDQMDWSILRTIAKRLWHDDYIHYKNMRCTRTLYDVAKFDCHVWTGLIVDWPRHDAASDCNRQIEYVVECLKILRGTHET